MNYTNGKAHGLHERYWSNGKLDYKVNYVNGNFHGLSEDYNYEGDLLRKQFFL
jgi:antitoxin component YwqK of YwqJK toxin-antitoxin module